MRRFIALLLLCSLSVHCAGRLGIVASWWLNRTYIAQVLCVNRDKPQMHCNGKCHLAKQLKAQSEREQKQDSAGKVFHEITLFCVTALPFRPAPAAVFLTAPQYGAFCVARYAWDQPGPDHPPAQG